LTGQQLLLKSKYIEKANLFAREGRKAADL